MQIFPIDSELVNQDALLDAEQRLHGITFNLESRNHVIDQEKGDQRRQQDIDDHILEEMFEPVCCHDERILSERFF